MKRLAFLMDSWSKCNKLKPYCSLYGCDMDSEYHQFLNDPEGRVDGFEFTNCQLPVIVLKVTYCGDRRNRSQHGNGIFHGLPWQSNAMTSMLCLRCTLWTLRVKAVFSEA